MTRTRSALLLLAAALIVPLLGQTAAKIPRLPPEPAAGDASLQSAVPELVHERVPPSRAGVPERPDTVRVRRIEASAAGEIAGRVFDAATGEAVRRFVVDVHLEEAGGEFGPFAIRQAAVSSARGEFRIGGLAPGRYRIEVVAEGLAPGASDVVSIRAGDSIDLDRIDLDEAAVAHGFVVAGEDGRPIPDARVVAVAGRRTFVSTSDAAGAFTIRGLPAGRASIEVEAEGREPLRREVDLEPGRPTGILELRLLPTQE